MGRKSLRRDIYGKSIRHHKAYVAGGTGHIRVAGKLQEEPEEKEASVEPAPLKVVENESQELEVDIEDVEELEIELEDIEELEKEELPQEEPKAEEKKPKKRRGRPRKSDKKD